MEYIETKLKGCFIIQPKVFKDARGYFFESFSQRDFELNTQQNGNFVQDNQSYSTFGVVRGLHFQKGAHAQAKLVRALKGKIIDVAVDIRKDSATYGEFVAVELSDENQQQLYVPRGFAHGFSVLSEDAIFAYKCDNYYNFQSEGGIRFNDPALNINWGIEDKNIVSSEKDNLHPLLNDFVTPF